MLVLLQISHLHLYYLFLKKQLSDYLKFKTTPSILLIYKKTVTSEKGNPKVP